MPYFTYVGVAEQSLDDARAAVGAAQAAVRAARRDYHTSMDNLEQISLDIQRAQAHRYRSTRGAEPTPDSTTLEVWYQAEERRRAEDESAAAAAQSAWEALLAATDVSEEAMNVPGAQAALAVAREARAVSITK